MKKRLRKKKRIKEFAEYMFEIVVELDSSISEDDELDLVDDLYEFLEDSDMSCGGLSIKPHIWSFDIFHIKHISTTKNDRISVFYWFINRKEVIFANVSEMFDAYYCDLSDVKFSDDLKYDFKETSDVHS